MIIPGNQIIQSKLLNAATEGNLHSAYLFIGKKGIGKEAFAVSLAAMANNTENKYSKVLQNGSLTYIHRLPKTVKNNTDIDTSSLNEKQLSELKSLIKQKDDFTFTKIEPNEAGLIKIGQIRAAIKNLKKTTSNRHRFIIIPDAESMNVQTANAFLKTLEEPPESTTIILTTSEPKNILQTIRSRCLNVIFSPPDYEEIRKFINGHPVFSSLTDEEKINIAKISGGSIVRATDELLSNNLDMSDIAINFLRLTLRPSNYQIELLDYINKEIKILDKISISELLQSLAEILKTAKLASESIFDEFLTEERYKVVNSIGKKFGANINSEVFKTIDESKNHLEVNVSKDLIFIGISLSLRSLLLR